MQSVIVAISALMAVGGLALIVVPLRYIWRGRARYAAARASWRTTNGRIVSSHVTAKGTGGKVDQYNTARGSVFLPFVSFSYTVGDVERRSERGFLIDPGYFLKADAEAWLASVAPGAVVPVFYDPRKLEDAALTLNRPRYARAAWAMSVGLATLVGAAWFYISCEQTLRDAVRDRQREGLTDQAPDRALASGDAGPSANSAIAA